MPGDVIIAVLCAAVLHAGWNAMAKGRGGKDPLIATMALGIGTGLVAIPVLAVAGLPRAESYAYVVASGIIHVAYFVLVGLSYRYADYSAVYPLMRGCAPLLTTLAGAALLSEPLTPKLLAGVLLLCGGVLGLGSNAMLRGGLDRRGLTVAVANIGVIVAYTLVDGLGARLSANPVGYVAAALAATAVLLLPVAIWLRPGTLVADSMVHWRVILIGGSMAMTSYGVALWAMTRAPIGAVAALRETSVLFGTIIAAVVLKEHFGIARWISAAFITAGLAVIRLM